VLQFLALDLASSARGFQFSTEVVGFDYEADDRTRRLGGREYEADTATKRTKERDEGRRTGREREKERTRAGAQKERVNGYKH
jgi:hypothetical protein